MEDTLGRRTELTVNASGLAIGQVDARGTSLVFERDGRGLVTAIRRTDGKSVQRHFNAAGQYNWHDHTVWRPDPVCSRCSRK